jgi:hypothetical protein
MYYFTVYNPITLEAFSVGAENPSHALRRAYNMARSWQREWKTTRPLFNLCIYRGMAQPQLNLANPAYIVRLNGDMGRVEGFLYVSPYGER